MNIILATGNLGKVKEFNLIAPKLKFLTIRELCPDVHFDPEETGLSFAENALIKAQAAARIIRLDCHASKEACNDESLILSDDSGIEIYALDGRPGIYAARYLKEHGIEGILKELGDNSNRRCRFVCHITVVNTEGEIVFETEKYWTGKIAYQARGTNGFGYDPIVIPDQYPEHTVAELDDNIKSRISHRAQALNAVITSLAKAKQSS